MESLSPSSSATQATGLERWCTHSASNVVFPHPAGAHRRSSWRVEPWFSLRIRCGRATPSSYGHGQESFVVSRGTRRRFMGSLTTGIPQISRTELLTGRVTHRGVRCNPTISVDQGFSPENEGE